PGPLPTLGFFFLGGGPPMWGGALARPPPCGQGAAQAADPLSPAEEAAFRALVLREQPGYRARGWRSALRGACGKVVAHLRILE
ncbi:hypothetical protein ABT288_28285, partial [Streptomyces sp. NPDC001093]|uniref:hypothetical protein n=1 Tax=Streptomyces sp. NPDC001093 TaxID=3154376 RepID=UPI00332B2A9A